jgi:hypothetical protein
MINYLNIENWLAFIIILFRGIYPVIFILIIIGLWNNCKRFILNKYSRLLIILFFVSFIIRFLKYFSQGWLSERYLLPLVLVITPFAAKGFYDFTKYINHKLLAKKFTLKTKNIFIIFTIIVALIMLGKSLRPHWDKPWFISMRNIVNNEVPANESRLIISNINDNRLGYYTKAQVSVLNLKNNNLTNLYNYIHQSECKHIYLFLDGVKPITFKKMFLNNNISFDFKLLKEYKDRHGNPVCFYKYLGSDC